ncbi:hypothetical protein OB446_027300 [Paenibacillus alvei]|uniref:hypothetical protein n=1 Tax=Paenibacillus alvei TaxID=44250 RepID=UPI000287EC9C|nr:hypothetical protein [Paenibacillus alvei]EJW13987.1 hypothetical protein PAV_141p00930 [Paenibacillus alvei DSM 29]MCY9707652.1 hypothetical protein [Paenibacillus alvei]MEC0082836.1 hypothetical protein [Paenibacillus alvei]
MKKVSIASLTLLLSCSLFMSAVSASPKPVESPDQRVVTQSPVTVRDIVPTEYFAKYAGKFSTYAEVEQATGFTRGGEPQLLSDVGTNSIKINSVDEYAALLNYFSEFSTHNTSMQVQNTTTIEILADGEYTKTDESKFYDWGVWWMKAFVIAKYDKNDKVIGTPTTDSGLYGFHPMNTYKHSSNKSTVQINSKKTGGSAQIKGDLTVRIEVGGVGDILTKEIEHDMFWGTN